MTHSSVLITSPQVCGSLICSIFSYQQSQACRSSWDLESAKPTVLVLCEPDGIDSGVTSLAISPDGELIAADLNTVVLFCDAEVLEATILDVCKPNGIDTGMTSVAIPPDS